MKLLLITLALGVTLIDVVSAGCCMNCVGTCRWVPCQHGRTDITCGFGKREALEEAQPYIQSDTRVESSSSKREAVEKREAEEGCSRVCSFGNTGCTMICHNNKVKREAVEEVVEKREAQPYIVSETSATTNKKRVFKKKEGTFNSSACYETGEFLWNSRCHVGCTIRDTREAEEGCSRVCSFGNTGCTMICKREASEGSYSCTCNSIGVSSGRCTECRDGSCAAVSSCNGKREAVDRFIEKREAEEEKCHLRCHDQGCDLLPKGCQQKKRDVEQLHKRSAELAAESEGKCHLRCHDQGCDLLPKGCQEKRKRSEECSCHGGTCNCNPTGLKREAVEKREAEEGCSRVCSFGNTGCTMICKRDATEAAVVEKRAATEEKCHIRCHDQGCDLLPKGCKQDKRDAENLRKRSAEAAGELGAGCRLDCSHMDMCYRVCV